MAAFSLWVGAAIRGSPIPISIATETAKFQIAIHPANITGWSIRTDTKRAIKQMRRAQNVPVQLFIHHKRFKPQTEDKESDVTIEYYYYDDELEERRGIRRRRNLSQK